MRMQTIQHRLSTQPIGFLTSTVKALRQVRPLSIKGRLNCCYEIIHLWLAKHGHISLIEKRRNFGGDNGTSRCEILKKLHRIHMTCVVVDSKRQQGHIRMSQIPGESAIRSRTQKVNMREAIPITHVRTLVRLAHRTHKEICPFRCTLHERFKHAQIKLVGINRSNKDQNRTLSLRPIRRLRKESLMSLAKVISISNITEGITPGIERSKLLMQLRRCGEQSINRRAKIPLSRLNHLRWHSWLCLNTINAQINGSLELT